MKFFLLFVIIPLFLPSDVKSFDVKRGKAGADARREELKKDAAKPSSDQMAKMQEQILKRMYEQKLAQEGGNVQDVKSQDDIISNVISELEESPTPVPSQELLNDLGGEVSEPDVEVQPLEIIPKSSDSEVIVPQAPPLPPASSLDKPKGPIKVKTKDWGEKYASVAAVYAQVSKDRENLKNIREKYISKYLSEREKEKPDYVSIVRSISREIIDYVNKMFEEVIQRLGPVPTKFSIFSMGSLAREESGFFTDLEIGVLVQEKTPEVAEYFKKFAQIVSDRLYLLGEHPDVGGKGFRMDEADNSPIHLKFPWRYMAEDVLQQVVGDLRSLKLDAFDGVDKFREITPTEGSNCFVVTPKDLAKKIDAKYMKERDGLIANLKSEASKNLIEKFNTEESSDKGLDVSKRIDQYLDVVFKVEKSPEKSFPLLSRNLVHLYGNKEIFDDFLNEMNIYLDGEPLKKTDKYENRRQEIAFQAIESNTNQNTKKKTAIATGILGDSVDLKRQLYRYVEQILTSLSFYNKLGVQNGIDIANELSRKGLMDKELAEKTIDLVNYLIGLRLRKQEKLRSQGYAIAVTSEQFEREQDEIKKDIENEKASFELLKSTYHINERKLKAKIDKARTSVESMNKQIISNEKISKNDVRLRLNESVEIKELRNLEKDLEAHRNQFIEAEMNLKKLQFKLKSLEKYRPGKEDSILGPDEIKDLNEVYLPILNELYRRAVFFIIQNTNDAFSLNKTDFLAAEKRTQLEAHLLIPGIKEKIKENFFQDQIKSEIEFGDLPEMVKEMNSNARNFIDTHYDFYHAQTPTLRVNQDAYKAFYEFFAIKAKIKDFTFLRCLDPIFSEVDTVEEFLVKEFEKNGIIDDNKINYFILSVNLSPFGNAEISGESTYHFYLKGSGIMPPEKQAGFLDGMFKAFGLNEKFIPRLQEIGRSIDTPTGSFFQIFIPKTIVDKIGYLSWKLGIPFDEESIKEVFGKKGIFTRYDNLQKKVDNIRESYTSGKNLLDEELSSLLQSLNKDENRLSKFLDLYRFNPSKMMNYVQARLLFTNDIMLNPDSGVIIYRYTDIPKEKYDEYQKELAKIIDEILVDWIEKNSDPATTKFSEEELNRMRTLLAQMKVGREFEGQEQVPAGKDILSKVRILQEHKEKQSEISASSEKRSEAVASLEQRLEKERKERMKEIVRLHDEEKKDSENSKQLSPFEALDKQRQIREEKIRKGESLNLEEEPKIEPGKISQKRLGDLVDTLEYKKEPLPEPGKLKGEQANVKNQLEKIFGKKSDATPDVSDEAKPLPRVGKVNPAIQQELEKFFASQKKEPKKVEQPVRSEKEKTPKSSSIVKKIEVKPGEIPPPPPLPMPSIKKIPAASPAA